MTQSAKRASDPSPSAAARSRPCPLCHSDRSRRLYDLDRMTVIRCDDCGFVYSQADIAPSTIESLYGEEYYRRRSQYYFENAVTDGSAHQRDGSTDAFQHGLDLLAQHRPGKGRLLDLGCAIGVFVKLAEQNGWDAQGVDISKFAVKYAREALGVEATAGQLETLAFPDNHFDVVTLWDVVEHLVNPIAKMREVRRILKDDGILLLDTPNERALLRKLARAMFLTSGGTLRYPVRKLYHEFHLCYFDATSLGRLLDEAGFEVVHLHRQTIPWVKARGSSLERAVVRSLAWAERLTGTEYELLAIARPRPGASTDRE